MKFNLKRWRRKQETKKRKSQEQIMRLCENPVYRAIILRYIELRKERNHV